MTRTYSSPSVSRALVRWRLKVPAHSRAACHSVVGRFARGERVTSSLVSEKSGRIVPRYPAGGRERPFIPGPCEAAEELGSSRPARSGTRTVAGARPGTEPVSGQVGSAGGGNASAAMSEPEAVVVGIEVAKAAWDVAVRPGHAERQLLNDAAGGGELVAWRQPLPPEVLGRAATGGDAARVGAAGGLAGRPVAVGNPRPGRAFAKASGQLAKTARLAAPVLAQFAAARRPAPRPLPAAPAQEVAALVERRRPVV